MAGGCKSEPDRVCDVINSCLAMTAATCVQCCQIPDSTSQLLFHCRDFEDEEEPDIIEVSLISG